MSVSLWSSSVPHVPTLDLRLLDSLFSISDKDTAAAPSELPLLLLIHLPLPRGEGGGRGGVDRLIGLVVKAPASERQALVSLSLSPRFFFFFWVESYKQLKIVYFSGYPVRRLAV